MMTLRLTEIFYSIQGESRWAGLPCVFVRLAGCNLRCSWCDTTYAFGPGIEMSLDEIQESISRYPCRLVEVTGGEPLLQPACADLLGRLVASGYRVLLETSGAQPIEGLPPEVIKVLDVKCPGSGESHRNLYGNLAHLRVEDDVKFVMVDRADFDFAVEIVRRYGLDGRVGLLFSPVWGVLDPRELAAWLLESGLTARFQIQIHKIIWGADARSV